VVEDGEDGQHEVYYSAGDAKSGGRGGPHPLSGAVQPPDEKSDCRNGGDHRPGYGGEFGAAQAAADGDWQEGGRDGEDRQQCGAGQQSGAAVTRFGQAVPAGSKPMIVVAHSMGGLVVREAMNKYRGTEEETPVPLFISIATPFGGHPAAAKGEKHGPMVLPSWRDLNPDGAFIDQLFTKPLPGTVDHRLLYAYRNPDGLKMGENSDGVVPLSSQLHPAAQRQAAMQFGFNSSHTGILQDEAAIQLIVESIDEVGSYIPESNLDALMEGGYDVELNDTYSDMDKYFVRTLGKFMALLANGTLDPLGEPTLEHFVAVAQGRETASTDAEKAWLKFSHDYPDYAE
jgi:pimeloyl-ACP methyl ester carboxylesterase